MKAMDVMVRDVVTVKPDDAVANAIKLLAEHDVSALPVVDDDGRVIGVISEADLVHREEIGTEKHRPWWLEALTPASTLAEDFAKSHGRRIDEIMSTKVVSASEETPLGEIATLLEKHRIKRVPILRNGTPGHHQARRAKDLSQEQRKQRRERADENPAKPVVLRPPHAYMPGPRPRPTAPRPISDQARHPLAQGIEALLGRFFASGRRRRAGRLSLTSARPVPADYLEEDLFLRAAHALRCIKQLADEPIDIHSLGFSLEVEDEPVAQRGRRRLEGPPSSR